MSRNHNSRRRIGRNEPGHAEINNEIDEARLLLQYEIRMPVLAGAWGPSYPYPFRLPRYRRLTLHNLLNNVCDWHSVAFWRPLKYNFMRSERRPAPADHVRLGRRLYGEAAVEHQGEPAVRLLAPHTMFTADVGAELDWERCKEHYKRQECTLHAAKMVYEALRRYERGGEAAVVALEPCTVIYSTNGYFRDEDRNQYYSKCIEPANQANPHPFSKQITV